MTTTNSRLNSTLAMPAGLNPSTLDTITEVSHLLSRLRTPQPTTTSSTTGTGTGTGTGTSTNLPGATPAAAAAGNTTNTNINTTTAPTPSQPQSTLPPPPPPPSSASQQTQTQTQTPTASSGVVTTGDQQQQQQQRELTLKEIPAAADALKHRFQRARAQIRTLPDMGRGVGEQRAEMAVLEARLAKQREVLARLRHVGVRFAAETSQRSEHRSDGGGGGGTVERDGEGDSKMMLGE